MPLGHVNPHARLPRWGFLLFGAGTLAAVGATGGFAPSSSRAMPVTLRPDGLYRVSHAVDPFGRASRYLEQIIIKRLD
jgi:hypothetical protein